MESGEPLLDSSDLPVTWNPVYDFQKILQIFEYVNKFM
jgi:hypothetical protein